MRMIMLIFPALSMSTFVTFYLRRNNVSKALCKRVMQIGRTDHIVENLMSLLIYPLLHIMFFQITSFKEFFIRTNLPSSAIKDEDLIFQADIFNYMEEATTVSLIEMTKVIVLTTLKMERFVKSNDQPGVCLFICPFIFTKALLRSCC